MARTVGATPAAYLNALTGRVVVDASRLLSPVRQAVVPSRFGREFHIMTGYLSGLSHGNTANVAGRSIAGDRDPAQIGRARDEGSPRVVRTVAYSLNFACTGSCGVFVYSHVLVEAPERVVLLLFFVKAVYTLQDDPLQPPAFSRRRRLYCSIYIFKSQRGLTSLSACSATTTTSGWCMTNELLENLASPPSSIDSSPSKLYPAPDKSSSPCT